MRRLSGLLCVLAACPGPATHSPDAADLDAAVSDAPDIDAYVLSPWRFDASLDASLVDAPVDAMGIDAAPIPGWPAPITPMLVAWQSGRPVCHSFGAHVAWGVTWGSFAAKIGLQTIHDDLVALDSLCTVIELVNGNVAYVSPISLGPSVHESRTGRLVASADVSFLAVIAADPAGGVLVRARVSAQESVVRIDDAFTLDPSFGTGGFAALPGAFARAAVQPGALGPMLTVLAGDRLTRIDLHTGAPIAAFGTVVAPTATADVLALAPLAAGGIAVLTRGATATSIVVHRVAADGSLATPQEVDLPLEPRAAFADDAGRVIVTFALTSEQLPLLRLDAHTGALDLSFGTDGRMTVTFAATCGQGEWPIAWSREPGGALRGGGLGFVSSYRCANNTGTEPTIGSASYYRLDAP